MRRTAAVVIVLLFVTTASWAQAPSVLTSTYFDAQPDPAVPAQPPQVGGGGLVQPAGAGPAPFGNGEQPVLRFAGDNGPVNQFTFSLNDDTGYDDNVFGTDQHRARDFFTAVGPRVMFLTSRKHVNFDLDYAPFFQIYKTYSHYDSVNQTLNFDVSAELSPRFQLRLREVAAELYYGLFGGFGPQEVAGLGPPGTTVPFFINPNTRSIDSSSRVDLVFNKSARTSLDVFGGFSMLNYKIERGAGGTYLNLEAPSGGFSYSYRVTARGSFSLTYDYMRSVYLKTFLPPRFQTHSASLSYAYQASPAVLVSVWGGPEYTQIRETLALPFPPFGFVEVPFARQAWNWSAGFDVSRTTPVSTISLHASRYVSAGGGLLTAVNDTSGGLLISRRLTLGWTGNAGINYLQLRSLSFGGLPGGNYNVAYANLGFSHKLGERASIRFNYWGTRQRHGLGSTFSYADADRNRASVGINWDIGKVHLGH